MTLRHGQRVAKPSPHDQASEAELASRAALPPSASDHHSIPTFSLPPSAVPASSAHVNARRAASASAVTTLGGASNGLRARSRNGSWSFRRSGVKHGGSQGRSPGGSHGGIDGGSDGGITSGRSLSGRMMSGIFGKRRDAIPDSGPLRPSFHGGMVRLVSHNFPDIPLEEMKSDALWGKTWWWFGRVLDPRTTRMKRWMRFVALVHSASLAVDPCFLYLISYSPEVSCLFLETIFSIVLMVLRSACDLVFLVDAFLSLRTAYVSKEAIARGHGSEMVTNARKIARSRCSLGGVVFDIIATLPIPQVFVWVIAPMLIQLDKASYDFSTGGVTIAFSAIILQYVMKLILAARFTVRAQRVNGYIFGAAWWGFALNFIAYMIAAHVFGSLWYLLASERVATCFQTLCQQVPTSVCNPNYVTCPEAYETTTAQVSPAWAAWGANATLETTCFEGNGDFNFGIYNMALQLMKEGSAVAKIFFGLFFGIMTLSSFGNALVPSTNFVETTFAVIMVLSGLMLFTLLIGNIQVFLHSITSRMEEMQLRRRDLTWWMNRHQLPPALQKRVLRQEQQNFTATRGIDEEGLIRSMPKSVRRDIKRHLCLDLVKKVSRGGEDTGAIEPLSGEQQNFTATRGIDEEGLIRSMPKSVRRDIKRHLCLELVKKVGDLLRQSQ
ncbi:unnamed protein product [Closterium sp. Yama58-4]|nr:unnamed protein product [Closterium sp. Yama58-4]